MAEQNGEIIAGKNPVLEALRSGRDMNKVWIAEGVKKSGVNELLDLARERGVIVQFVPKRKLINYQAPIIKELLLLLPLISMLNLRIYLQLQLINRKILFLNLR